MTIIEAFEIGNKSLKQHPEFFRFLTEKGVYAKWVKNRTDFVSRIFAEHRIYPFLTEGDKMISTDDLLCYTQTSFQWGLTTEGHEFWYHLSREWRNHIDKNS